MTSEDRDPTIVEADEEGSRSSSSPTLTVEREQPRHLPWWQETGLLVIVAIVIAIVLKQFFVQAFYIPSESMEPGLVKNDRIVVEKPSYWFGGQPQRGDVIVFADPGGWLDAEDAAPPANPLTRAMAKIGLYPSGGHLVKRVIGVPGDTIVCCNEKGQLEVNGHALDESAYARPGTIDGKTCYGPMPGVCHWRVGPVPAGFLFVMGDNRAHSADSSFHLCEVSGVRQTDCANSPWVPEHDVVGKVGALIWPPGRAHVLHRPGDFNQELAP